MNGKSRLLKGAALSCCLSFLFFSSCDKAGNGEYCPLDGGTVEFDACIGPVTRSVIDWNDFKCEFEPGDVIGIYAVPSGASLAGSGNYADNVGLEKQDDGTWTYAEPEYPIHFPADDISLDIYAYYPYSESVNPLAMEFNAGDDQTGGAADSDLMWASLKNVSDTGNEVSLVFGHVLSMIQLDVSSSETSSIQTGQIGRMDVKLNGLRSALTFNLADGSASATGEQVRINMERRASDSWTFRALVPVQPVVAGSILFSCTVEKTGADGAGSDYTQLNYEAVPETVLESGKVRLYSVKLP